MKDGLLGDTIRQARMDNLHQCSGICNLGSNHLQRSTSGTDQEPSDHRYQQQESSCIKQHNTNLLTEKTLNSEMETNIHFAVFLCRQRIILFIRLSLRFFLYFVQTEIKKALFFVQNSNIF